MITATASVLPEKIITNNDLSKMMDTSDEWISTRTGIRERRCVTNQETSDLCILVAEKLIKQKNLNPKDLDFILVATMGNWEQLMLSLLISVLRAQDLFMR